MGALLCVQGTQAYCLGLRVTLLRWNMHVTFIGICCWCIQISVSEVQVYGPDYGIKISGSFKDMESQ